MSADLDALLVTMHQTTKDLVALAESARGNPDNIRQSADIMNQCQRLAYAALWAQHAYMGNLIRRAEPTRAHAARRLAALLIHTEYALQAVHASKPKAESN